MIIFQSKNAVCPYCKKKMAYGDVMVRPSPSENESNVELLTSLFICKNPDCKKMVGFGCKIKDGEVEPLNENGIVKVEK